MTTTRGSGEGMAALAAMSGEAMVDWFRDLEGFEGLLMLTNEETGTTLAISFWESRESSERSLVARMQFRDRITATVNVEVEASVPYEVAFVDLPGLRAPVRD
ncbi:MAG: hypothetical protein ACXWZB_03760 [Gaiellaceae bacterium]